MGNRVEFCADCAIFNVRVALATQPMKPAVGRGSPLLSRLGFSHLADNI